MAGPVVRLREEGKSPVRDTARAPARSDWIEAFRAVRQETERRAAPLRAYGQRCHARPGRSPTNWHGRLPAWVAGQFPRVMHRAGDRAFGPEFAYRLTAACAGAGPRQGRRERSLSAR